MLPNIKSFFPNGKWFAGLTFLLVAYIGYATMGPVIETTLPASAQLAGTNPWGMEIISALVTNWWYGIVMIFLGFLGYLIIAGIPGTEVEEYHEI